MLAQYEILKSSAVDKEDASTRAINAMRKIAYQKGLALSDDVEVNDIGTHWQFKADLIANA